MNFFTKKSMVFEELGQKEKWKKAKEILKGANIDISSGTYPSEPPMGGWGARIDLRDLGPKGKIDREVYYIEVAVKEAQMAKDLLAVIK